LVSDIKRNHRLRVFVNRVLGRIFGPKREGLARGFRRLHNEGLHDLYASANVIRVIASRRMRWAGHVASMEEIRHSYEILVGKPEGKRPFGRHRLRWGDNIRQDLREIRWEGVDWMQLTQDRD
jgi:hypothetical protein